MKAPSALSGFDRVMTATALRSELTRSIPNNVRLWSSIEPRAKYHLETDPDVPGTPTCPEPRHASGHFISVQNAASGKSCQIDPLRACDLLVVSPRERPPVMNRCFLARYEPPEIDASHETTPTHAEVISRSL